MRTKIFSPFWLPIWFFSMFIILGGLILTLDECNSVNLGLIDALFTATSAMCVTGLAVVDTGSFTTLGQIVIMALIQLGGLGIMTYASLTLYLLRRRVSVTDHIAVGQSLLHDPSFRLGSFLMRVVIFALAIEICGALMLFALAPGEFSLFSALFHAISAFCNAGFSTFPDSLMRFNTDVDINLVFMVLIILGGLGFSVLLELADLFWQGTRGILGKNFLRKAKLSWHASLVLKTSAFLIIAGAVAIFIAEKAGGKVQADDFHLAIMSLFQSVTCRTAGFNTMQISHMTNISLAIMLGLMIIGGSPGSCAGGIKTTTFRVWIGFISSRLKGLRQTRVGKGAITPETMNKAFTLIVFTSLFILAGTLLMDVAEGGEVPHHLSRGFFLDVLFETVSAFATVGLSTGITPS